MTLYGYARVSTTDQDLALQETALRTAGCQVIRSEKKTGTRREGRAELREHRVQPPLARWGVLGGEKRCARPFAADGEALQQPAEDQQQRRGDGQRRAISFAAAITSSIRQEWNSASLR